MNKHDGGWGGGPDLKFTWGCVGLTMTGSVNTYSIRLTKDEIGKPKQLNVLIQPSWGTYEKNNYLLIVEKDGGKDKTMTKILTSTFGGEHSVAVTIPYEKNDDFLFDRILERTSIFSSTNKPFGEWTQYQGDDFWFTLPTE